MIVKLTATDGSPVEFVDEVIGSGAMKDVYFSPDKSYLPHPSGCQRKGPSPEYRGQIPR